MKISVRTILLAACVLPMLLAEMVVVPEAEAVFGTRRRTAMVTAAVVKSQDQQQQQQQQAAAPQSQAQQPQAQPAPAQPATPPAAGGPLPLGTVVRALPAGCTAKAVGGVEYQQCGSNYFRAAFQGSDLVYVTAKP
jgi:hypothetical protein